MGDVEGNTRYFFVVFLAKKMRGQPPENAEPLGWPPVIGLTGPYYESMTANSFATFNGPFVVSKFVSAVESQGLRQVCVTSFSEVDQETFLANQN